MSNPANAVNSKGLGSLIFIYCFGGKCSHHKYWPWGHPLLVQKSPCYVESVVVLSFSPLFPPLVTMSVIRPILVWEDFVAESCTILLLWDRDSKVPSSGCHFLILFYFLGDFSYQIMVCHCKPPQDGKMGCADGCLNRMLNIECVRGTCPCADLCSNQQVGLFIDSCMSLIYFCT